MSARPSSSLRRRLSVVAVLGIAGAATLSACGSSDDDGGDAGGGTLRVTTLGLCNEVVYWAQEKGLFADHGVEVELVKSTGGAAALTALQSGDIDLAFANPFSTMLAIDQGLDLKWIATAYETTTNEADAANAMVVAKDGGVAKAADLEGKTIGVNEVGGINQIISSQWMKLNGGDPGTVKFVALPFNELASAVASGKVAAAQVPAQNVDPKLGLVSLGDPYVAVGEGEGLVFAGYVATGKEAKDKEKELTAFQDALIETNAAFNDPANDDERFAIASAQCKQDAAVLETLPENIYEAKVDTDALERMGAILVDQGRLDDPPAPEDFVPSFVETK
ncbi:ABC transporter substrate-binding protein [Nocardioides nitrophenolicus]|uniref:ABC transporter substrate-binding protein n=1 Tax=Nocardioides nitrophenolicus TaxID=60489 RepID=UPI001956FBF4|nr:ABC transporter substrate-binding protein [Nocardioides nitrophenolicus]MBM7517002.1 NitT/TauT family transport system substrate-binding protein [Nocardioides nitrophenolicus]